MHTRDDILERLLEPYLTLTAEDLQAASEWASRDQDVAQALQECRTLSGLSEAGIFGEPSTSDAAFLVELRNRILPASVVPMKAVFATGRRLAMASVACVALLAVILSANAPSKQAAAEETAQIETVADALDNQMTINWDSLDTENVDPDSLANYLGVTEFANQWGFTVNSEEPLADVLLELDAQSIEEVLNKLESTNFF
jgi:hypothetical protein